MRITQTSAAFLVTISAILIDLKTAGAQRLALPASVVDQIPNGPAPKIDETMAVGAQRNAMVSTLSVGQVSPLSAYITKPEQVIEHEIPWQPPQREGPPALEPPWLQDVAVPVFQLLPTTPSLLQSFQGISYTAWTPPDPIIAAGPNHVVVATNSS
jgi:hypothetical protein